MSHGFLPQGRLAARVRMHAEPAKHAATGRRLGRTNRVGRLPRLDCRQARYHRKTMLLAFEDEWQTAERLARECGRLPALIERHRFPDGELKLRLPSALPEQVVLLRSLAWPNEKLVELLLVA